MGKQLQNFHVPLPPELYQELRAEAERQQKPATSLAREAIAAWITEQHKQLKQQEIMAYALEVAGTEDDLDQELEAASIEHLMENAS